MTNHDKNSVDTKTLCVVSLLSSQENWIKRNEILPAIPTGSMSYTRDVYFFLSFNEDRALRRMIECGFRLM